MAQPPRTHLNVPTGTISGFDGVQFYPVKVDSSGNLYVVTTLDFVADVEIDGTQVLNRKFAPASSGDNTLVTVGASNRIKLYKVTISPSADITGNIVVKLGATELGGVASPKVGGQYVLVSCMPDFELGALDEDIIINLPSATAVIVNVTYEVI